MVFVLFAAPASFVSAASCASAPSGTTFDQIRSGGVNDFAVQFTLASQCDVSTLTAAVNKYSSPSDDVIFAVYDDSGGLPGSSVISTTLPNASVPVYPTVADSDVSATGCLDPGTYWFVVTRVTPAGSGNFLVYGDTGSGAYTKAKNDGSWSAYTTAYDVDYTNFRFNVEDGGNSCVLPPPPPAPGLAEIIDNSTSSVERTTGFGMNAMALWGWINIGKPALGMGLGTLYVLRWYILAIIALAIILYFSFRYFGYFKH